MTNSVFSVLCAGLVVLDVVLVNGDIEPLYQAGGTCCNVGCMLGYMGAAVNITGRLGADASSIAVINDLHLHNVNTTGIIYDLNETPSIIEKVNPETAQHSFSLRCPLCKRHLTSYRSITLGHANEIRSANLTNVDLFFFDRVSPGNLLLAEEARKNGAVVFFEPPRMEIGNDFFKAAKLSHIVKYASSTLGKNLVDGLWYPNDFSDIPILEIETLGSDGLRFRQNRREWTNLGPHKASNTVDTAGAGDWLSASFIHALLSGKEVMQKLLDPEAVSKHLLTAQQIASYNCQYIGARGAMDFVEFSAMIDKSRNNKSSENFPRRQSAIKQESMTGDKCHICLK